MKRRGVSLVELLIAITVLGILAAAMTRLLVSNSKADETTSAAREARGVSRSAMNLLETELRMAEPAGVISPTDDSTITVRAPFAFGLVCAASGGGSTVAMLPSADLPSSLSVTGYSGWAWRDNTGGYVYESTTTIGSGSSATCTAANITPLTSDGGRVVSLPAPSGTVAVGAVAFLYRQITYSLRESTTYPGRRALFRTAGANGSPEELAGPFSTGSRFRWYLNGETLVQDTLPTFFDDLLGVQFVLNGESVLTPRNASAPMRAPFTTAVFFQNRPN
jgi:prepilin-type N-terminal cleavage/methylation domain-containing protein